MTAIHSERVRVVAYSPDRLMLRRLTRWLESVGCEIHSTTTLLGFGQLAAQARADLLIIDDDPGFESLAQLKDSFDDDSPAPVTLALVARDDAGQTAAALAASADDVLVKPLIAGELLARLRAAVRLREQLWRRHWQLGRTALEGCLPIPAWQALAAELTEQNVGLGALALLRFDCFESLLLDHGVDRIAALHAKIVERLQSLGDDAIVWGELEEFGLAALLSKGDDSTAKAWADRVCLALQEKPFEVDGVELIVTASIGIAILGSNAAAAEAEARGALQLARNSGGDLVCSGQEWEQECRRLADEPDWIDSAWARDVMQPVTLTLSGDDSIEQAKWLLSQTQSLYLPVVDASGHLQGVVLASAVEQAASSAGFVRNVTTAAAQFEEDAPLARLRSFFATSASEVAVVVRQGRPIGLIGSRYLAELASPLTRQSFTSRRPFSFDSAYLTTPDLAPTVG